MPSEVSGTPEELESQGFSTSFQPEDSFFGNYLKQIAPPPRSPVDQRAQREAAYNEFNPEGGAGGAGITSGLLGAGESAAGFGEATVGSLPVVGKYVKPYLKDFGDYLSGIASQIPQRVPSVSDVKTAGDIPDYAEGKLGEMMGFLAPTILLSLLSGGTSAEVAAGKAVADEMSLGISKDLANKLVAGGFIASEIGTTYRGIRDATGKEAPFTSIVAGTASGLLLNAGAAPAVKQFLDGAESEVKKQFLSSYMADVLNTAVRHGAFLGGASAGSHAIHLLADKFSDSTYQLVNSQNLIGITDSFVAGLLGGGVMGAGGKALRGYGPLPEADAISQAQAESGLRTPVGAGAESVSPVDIFLNRDRQQRAAARDQARAESDLAMEQAGRPEGPGQPNPFSPPPDAGIEAAKAEAASHISNAAEISAQQAEHTATAAKPVTDAIIADPSKPAPPPEEPPASAAAPQPEPKPNPPAPAPAAAAASPEVSSVAETEKTTEPVKVESPATVPEEAKKVEEKPAQPPQLPKPTKEERARISKQRGDLNRFTKEVNRLHKALDRMSPEEVDGADRAFADSMRKWKDLVPADVLDNAIKGLSDALEAKRAITHPEVGGLLVDVKGRPANATISYEAGTGKVLIRSGKQIAYTSKRTFSSMDAFQKEREQLLSDSANWERHKNAGSWMFHDAPRKISDKDTWAAGLIYHLRKIDAPLADAVEKALASDAIDTGHILGIIGANEKIVGGEAKRVYPNTLSPSRAAEVLPDAIKKTLEREIEANKVEAVAPEDAADLSEGERAALGAKTAKLKFLKRALSPGSEEFRQWLESGKERHVAEPLASTKELKAEEGEGDETEAEDDETGEPKEKPKGAAGGSGDSHADRINKFSDHVAGQFVDRKAGDAAGDLVFRAATDGSVDKILFLNQMSELLVGNAKEQNQFLHPEKALEIASQLYDMADSLRSGGDFRGAIAQGVDHKPQTSGEKPIAHASAVGAKEIFQLINDPRYGFSDAMRRFTAQFLRLVDPMYLEGLTLQAVSRIDVKGNSVISYEGSFEPLLRIAKVALNSRNPDVIAHEISHNLYYYLPESLRQRVDWDWGSAVEAKIERETDPVAISMLREALKRGGIRQADYQLGRIADVGQIIDVIGPDGKTYKVRFDGAWDLTAMGRGKVPQVTAMEDIPGVTIKGSSHMVKTLTDKGVQLPEDILGKIKGWDPIEAGGDVGKLHPFHRLYHLINPEEYFVHQLLQRTSQTGVWQYAKDFIRQLMNAVKGLFGLEAGGTLWDQIADGFRNGSFENRYSAWGEKASTLGSISRDRPEFEKNILRSPTASQRLLEATSALAQNLSLSRVSDRIAETLGASPRARKLSGVTGDIEASAAAKDYTDPNTYLENRQRLGADTPQWATIADDTFKKYRARDIKLQKLKAAEAKQKEYIESDEFAKKIARKADLEGRISTLKEQQHDTLKTSLAETIKANQKILEQENLEEGKASQLRNEITALEAITKNKVGGLEQLMNHIINVVSLSPDGQALLLGEADVKGSDILKAYEAITGRVDAGLGGDLKFEVPHGDLDLSDKEIDRLEKQANQLRRPNQALYSIASDMIARQKSVSQQLMVAELVKNNPAIYNEYADQFGAANLDKITKNPDAFAAKMSRDLLSAGKKEGVLAHAIAVLNKNLVKEVNWLLDTRSAAKIIEETFKDPDVSATYKQAALDSKQVLTPPVWAGKAMRPDTLVQKRKFVLPDKSEIDVDFSVNEKVPAEYEKVQAAASKIWDYMQSDAGQLDPYLPYWQEQHKALFSIYASDVFLGLIKTKDPITFGFGEIRLTVPRIQTRQGNLATIAATNWEHAVKAFGHWILGHSEKEIKVPLFNAAKSHQELGKVQSSAEAVNLWRNRIGRELTGRANAIGETWRVGDPIGDGSHVTAEDIELLRSMSAAVDAAYSLSPQKGRTHLMVRQYVEDAAGTLREPLKKRQFMLPANFSRAMVEFSKLVKAAVGGREIENLSASDMASIDHAFDEYFHESVKPFLDDTEVRVDGGGFNFPLEAYRTAYERVRAGDINDIAGLVRHFTSYAIGDEIHSDWVHKRLLEELTKQSDTIYEATTSMNTENRFMALDSYNSFTLARGKRIANYGFYEYGLFDDIGIRNLADDGSSFYFDRFRKSLQGVKDELSDITSRMAAQNKGGMKGDTYRDYQELKHKLRDVNNLITQLDHAEGRFGRYQSLDMKGGRRLMNTLVTAAIANPITGLGDLSGNWIRTVEYMMTMFGRRALSPGWNIAFGKAVAKGVVLALKGTAGGAVAFAKGLKSAGSAREKAAVAFESAIHAFADAPFLAEMSKAQGNHARFLREMAALEYYHKVDPVRVGNKWRAPSTGGAIYDIKGDPQSNVRKMANFFNGGVSIIGTLMDAAADTLYRQFNITGDLGIASISHLALESIRLQLARTFENLGESGLRRQFNLDRPSDPKNVVHASMMLFDGATNSNLSHLSELTKLAGFSHNEMAVDYWRRLAQARPEARNAVPMLTPEQASMFARKVIEDINQPTISNRALKLKKEGWARLMYPLMGWAWNAAGQTLHWFSRAAEDPKRSTQQLRYLQLVTVAGLVAFAGASAVANEEVMRLLYKWMYDEVKPGRQPWETDTASGALKRTIIALSSILPVINIIPNLMFNDTPGSAAQGVDVFLQSKVKDLLGYAGGAIASHDPTYGLADLIRRTFPITRPFINQLPGYHGTLELRNASRLLQRYAPEDLRRPAGGPIGSTTATELTPYGRRMANAAMNGDLDELKKVYAEAVAKATELGRPDPDRVVRQLYESQNPVRSALKSAPSPDQWAELEGRMSDSDRQQFEDAIRKYAAGGEAIGVRVSVPVGSTPAGVSATTASGEPRQPAASPLQGGASQTLRLAPSGGSSVSRLRVRSGGYGPYRGPGRAQSAQQSGRLRGGSGPVHGALAPSRTVPALRAGAGRRRSSSYRSLRGGGLGVRGLRRLRV